MKKSLLSVALGITLSFPAISPLFSQGTLVKDVNIVQAQSSKAYDASELFCTCGDFLFFTSYNSQGHELWRTDGTEQGTIMIRDLNKGYANGGSFSFCNTNGELFFFGNDGVHGLELWITNGTASGTRMVKDVTVGPGGVSPLAMLGNYIYFVSDHDGDNVQEIWKSDGTESNTVLAATLPFSRLTNVYKIMTSNSHIFFHFNNIDTGKLELWSLDSSSGNVAKILQDLFISDFAKFGNEIMFGVQDFGSNTYSLWSSDGTSGNTMEIKNFGFQYPNHFYNFNDKLLFIVGFALWTSDGTSAGTSLVGDGSIGVSSIDASLIKDGYFYGIGTNQIIKTNGIMIEALNFSGRSVSKTIGVLDDKFILQYNDGAAGDELGSVETDLENFDLIKDINIGPGSSSPRLGARLGDHVIFLADDGTHGLELWITDATESGTYLLKDVTQGTADAFSYTSSGQNFLLAGNTKIHFLASSTVNPYASYLDLYSTDGTTANTTLKFSFAPGLANCFGLVNDELIYFNDKKIYKTNDLTNDVMVLKDLSSGSGTSGFRWKAYNINGRLIFGISSSEGAATGFEPWITDGTTSGTQLIKDINPGPATGWSGDGIVANDKFFFVATDPTHGSELWISDGTNEGTVLLKDINAGVSSSKPDHFALLGDKVVFSATESSHGKEVWITDGTPEGTTLLADLISGSESSEPRYFTSLDDLVLFSAYDEENGWRLWKTDGTPSGTAAIKDLWPGTGRQYYPSNFASINNKAYFSGDDGQHGMEVWVSDGTETGTYVLDVVPGATGSNPSIFTNINGVVYFRGDAALWRTNGTVAGTSKVSDLEPLEIVSMNNWIYFTAPHPDYGVELFKVEFSKQDQQITFEPISHKTFGDASFTIVGSASSGLPVQMTAGEELSITGQTATVVKPGTVSVTVKQAGDALFNAAEAVQTFCVLPAKPSVETIFLQEGGVVLTSNASSGNQWYKDNVAIAATDYTLSPAESGAYKVNVTVDGCTSEFSDEYDIIITGIEPIEDYVSFYPNPAREVLTIKSDAPTTQVNILNIQGASMDNFTLNGKDVVDQSLDGYPNGVYIIKFTTPNGSVHQKFVKE